MVKKPQWSNKHRQTAEQCESDLSFTGFTGGVWKPFLTMILVRSWELTDSNHIPKNILLLKCYLPILGDEGWVRETSCLWKSPQKSCQVQGEIPMPGWQGDTEDGSIVCLWMKGIVRIVCWGPSRAAFRKSFVAQNDEGVEFNNLLADMFKFQELDLFLLISSPWRTTRRRFFYGDTNKMFCT